MKVIIQMLMSKKYTYRNGIKVKLNLKVSPQGQKAASMSQCDQFEGLSGIKALFHNHLNWMNIAHDQTSRDYYPSTSDPHYINGCAINTEGYTHSNDNNPA